MALEQSINCDSKLTGVLVGITKQDGGVERWFLTSHEREAITRSLKDMCGEVVLPNEVADRMVNASQIGTTSMHEFINSRLDTNKVCFWDSLKKLKIDTLKKPRERYL